MEKIQTVRGMNDLLPQDSHKYNAVKKIISDILLSYGYNYIRTPIVEKTIVFTKAIGEVTDIVAKEMYSWQDNKQHLSLRPECTAGVVRAVIEHNLAREGVQKVFYHGPMFRHERPQKGRHREFFQLGAEIFGDDNIFFDIELIDTTYQIFKRLNIKAELQINTIGSQADRDSYKKKLISYLLNNKNKLDEDSKKRLYTNPLRILDSKNPAIKKLIVDAPKLMDYLNAESQQRFLLLQKILNELQISYKVNANLVRGLDYYNDIVFEWLSDKLGAQSTICAGGRYDKLVEIMGGQKVCGLGFAIGMERLLLSIDEEYPNNTMFYIISTGNKANKTALQIATNLRNNFNGIIFYNDLSTKSFKNKLRKAHKKNAKYVLIIGEKEYQEQSVSIKFMQEQKEQRQVLLKDLNDFLQGLI